MTLHATQIRPEAFRLPATPAMKAEAARAEFISSTEPECAAHFAYAAEDARDIAAMATATRSFLVGQIAKLRGMTYARAAGADLALMGQCVAEMLGEQMTPDAARYFDAEFAAISGEAA